jgi:hypothetical protein
LGDPVVPKFLTTLGVPWAMIAAITWLGVAVGFVYRYIAAAPAARGADPEDPV